MSIKSGILIAVLMLAPALAFAQTDPTANTTRADTAANTPTTGSATVDFSGTTSFQRDGVFGCNLNGAYSMSVGAMSAVGGAFVPVSDAAVTLNTGYLVYKECVLRGIVDRMRENATASLQKQILTAYERDRNGQPMFSQSIPLESQSIADKAVLDYLNSGQLNGLNQQLQGPIKSAIARGYMAARNTPNVAYGCPYTGNLGSVYSGNADQGAWSGLAALQVPGCDPIYAYDIANEQVLGSAAYDVNNNLTRLGWDNGNYPVMGTDANGNPIVLTPGSIVGANALQALQTGFVQLQNANDIDQMVGALFAGITSQVVGDNQGLIGLTQASAGQPSYLDQVVAQSTAGLRNSAINAGLQILVAQQQIEKQILALAQGILAKIAQVTQALQAKENACWTLVIKAVCATPPSTTNTCTAASGSCTTDPTTGQSTCAQGNTLKVATSTYQFTQQAINNSQVPSYQQIHQQIASTSQVTLTQIGLLITQLTDTSSYTGQLSALQGLDQLVAQGTVLHKPQDVTSEQAAFDTLVGQNGGAGLLDQFVTDTVSAWADSTADPTIGWCNINNPAVITMWQTRWKQ